VKALKVASKQSTYVLLKESWLYNFMFPAWVQCSTAVNNQYLVDKSKVRHVDLRNDYLYLIYVSTMRPCKTDEAG
jgi:hypothetical protein